MYDYLPDNRGCEERLERITCEEIRVLFSAYVRDSREEQLFGANLNKASDGASHYLRNKGRSRRYLHVVAKFLVLQEGHRFHQCLHAEYFEDLSVSLKSQHLTHHSRYGLALEEVSSDEFRQDIYSDELACHGVDKGGGNDIDERQQYCEEVTPDWQACVKHFDPDNGEDEAEAEDRKEPPIGDFGVIPHELHMDIVGFSTDVEDSSVHARTVVKRGMDDEAGRKGECEHDAHAE